MSGAHAASASWRSTPGPESVPWVWPIDVARYNHTPTLTPAEQRELALLASHHGRQGHWLARTVQELARLRAPILDTLRATGADESTRCAVLAVLACEMHRRGRAFWAWSDAEWSEILCPSGRAFEATHPGPRTCRAHLIAFAYLVGASPDLEHIGPFDRLSLARKVFGRATVDAAIRRVVTTLVGWGYGEENAQITLHKPVCEALLANRSPRLEDLTAELIDELRHRVQRRHLKTQFFVLARALFGLGLIDRPLPKAFPLQPDRDATLGVPPDWLVWCQRWRDTTTLPLKTRQSCYGLLLKAGRWAAAEYPTATSPETWTRETAAAWVAAVDRMVGGEWTKTRFMAPSRLGKRLGAKSKAHHLSALSTFFRDAQEWEWLPRRFDPRRSFAAPRSIRALIGPNPRVLADDVWAKLLWAGLNLTEQDLGHPGHGPAPFYPLAMVRAAAAVWLFAGLRSDEIYRLRRGCIRWQRSDPSAEDRESEAKVCLLDVPTHKTGPAFTKPVDRAVGEAIAAWEQVRPPQPAILDAKTGEVVEILFAYRGVPFGGQYLNTTLIPLLCRKAGIPERDARGGITSHRARSTIASQLASAREPMGLFELQAWLGHRWPASTQFYLQLTPTKLAKAYADTGYFTRNLRTIDVLIDQAAIKTGAAARGEPWRFYDLGHGLCTYEFFDQCPHRMACAHCAFYRPKASSQAQLLEGRANLLRLKQEIPLTDEEVAAVDDGLEALERLCAQLADVATPAGPTPRELGRELPVLEPDRTRQIPAIVEPFAGARQEPP